MTSDDTTMAENRVALVVIGGMERYNEDPKLVEQVSRIRTYGKKNRRKE